MARSSKEYCLSLTGASTRYSETMAAARAYADCRDWSEARRLIVDENLFGLNFTWDIDFSGALHARHLKIDNRWDILLDRGLDIWQRFDSNDAFSIEGRMPEMRRVKAFEITYMKVG